MEIAQRFVDALEAHAGEGSADRGGDAGLLPVRLVRAAAATLPVTGVGLSLHGPGLQTPLAASGAMATAAERWQFTAGQGPCQCAAETGLPVFGTENMLRQRWPVYHDLLVTNTRLRGVLALPLPGPLDGLGVLDLFFDDPAGPLTVDVAAARTVARLVSGRLVEEADVSSTPEAMPGWVRTPAAEDRARVWVAVGMVTLAQEVPPPVALALLRGYAYGQDRTVDDLAADLVHRRISPDRLGQIGHRDR